jgi:hypothetical protein
MMKGKEMRDLEYFASYGCYISMENTKVVVEDVPDDADIATLEKRLVEYFYYRAWEIADSCYGMHGFGLSEEDEEGLSEDEIDEVTREYIEDQVEYSVKPWNSDGHEGSCTYSDGLSVEVLHYKRILKIFS